MLQLALRLLQFGLNVVMIICSSCLAQGVAAAVGSMVLLVVFTCSRGHMGIRRTRRGAECVHAGASRGPDSALRCGW